MPQHNACTRVITQRMHTISHHTHTQHIAHARRNAWLSPTTWWPPPIALPAPSGLTAPKAVGGESTGYFITYEAVHDLMAKHQTRMAAGRALTVHAMAAARGPGEHYTPVVMTQHATHRCRVCSLDPNSNPIRRYDQMQSSTVMGHLGSADHHRSVADQHYERFAQRGVAWVPPPCYEERTYRRG